MEDKKLEVIIELPEGVEFKRENSEVLMTGPKGESRRRIIDPSLILKIEGKTITLTYEKFNKKNKRLLNTFAAHINNMIRGVTEGYTYKLKICSGHFPMNVSLKGDVLEIKNFIGESVPRKLKIKEGAEVKINGDEITVTSSNKELAGSTTGLIEKLTRRRGFDKRIFQDGIYITHKPKREL